MGGKATPAQLVLQLIKGILGIGPIPVELAQRKNLVLEIGDQHCGLVAGGSFAGVSIDFNETEQPLSVVFARDQYLALDGPTQNDNAPSLFPSAQTQTAVLAFPALTGVTPVGIPEDALNCGA